MNCGDELSEQADEQIELQFDEGRAITTKIGPKIVKFDAKSRNADQQEERKQHSPVWPVR